MQAVPLELIRCTMFNVLSSFEGLFRTSFPIKCVPLYVCITLKVSGEVGTEGVTGTLRQ